MEYSLCGVAFRLVCVPPSDAVGVARILESLFSLIPLSQPDPDRIIEIFIHILREGILREGDAPEEKVSGDVVFDAPGLSAIRTKCGYHLRSRGSFLSLDLRSGRAAGSLSGAFMDSSREDQRGIFFFAFLLLLSGRGLYGLHAAGVLWDGCGFLLAGGSGSGKTTLTCALARSGWQYLSDDSVLLRRSLSGVEALAFGRPFHCAPAMFRHFPELACGANPSLHGKRLVDVGPLYSGRSLSGFRPHVILFPEIASTPSSRLIPLSGTATLLRLLGEGVGLLHSRGYMAAQMVILGDLVSSVRGFRLMHGADVHTSPSRVSALLRHIANPDSIPQIQGDHIDAMCSAA